MKKTQNTRGYKRYSAIDTHREYHLVGAQTVLPCKVSKKPRSMPEMPHRISTMATVMCAALRLRQLFIFAILSGIPPHLEKAPG